MKEVVSEWVDKAEADLRTGSREFRAADRPNYDAVCFHAQQCVEKLMKAVLAANGVVPPRTHDLIRLSSLMQSVVPEWDWPLPDLRLLDQASVGFRYPGESADKEEAEESLAAARGLRDRLLALLEPSPPAPQVPPLQ